MTSRFNAFDHDLASFVAHATRDRTSELRAHIHSRIEALTHALQRHEKNPGIDLQQILNDAERLSMHQINKMQVEREAGARLLADLTALMVRAETIPNIEWAKLEQEYVRIEEEVRQARAERDEWRHLAMAREFVIDELASCVSEVRRELQNKNVTNAVLQKQVNDGRALVDSLNEKISELRAHIAKHR